MAKVKTQIEASKPAPVQTVQRQPEVPVKERGPVQAARTMTSVSGAPSGTPPRSSPATRVMAAPMQGFGASTRASAMMGMQQTMGNARSGQMMNVASRPSEGPRLEASTAQPGLNGKAGIGMTSIGTTPLVQKATPAITQSQPLAPNLKETNLQKTLASPTTQTETSKPDETVEKVAAKAGAIEEQGKETKPLAEAKGQEDVARKPVTEEPSKAETAKADDGSAAPTAETAKIGKEAKQDKAETSKETTEGADEAVGAAPNPQEAIAPAISAVRQRATGASKHSPPTAPVASAQAAGINPETEQTRSAATATVATLDEAKAEEVRRESFKAKLKAKIEAATTPQNKTESEAKRVMKTGGKEASGNLRGDLATERDAAAGPMKSAAETEASTSDQPAPPKTELQPEQVGPPPAPVSAAPVVPASLPPERLDYSSDRAPSDQLMAENSISKEQLSKGNEPEFGATLEARAAAETHEASAEATYRQSESKVQEKAQGQAQEALEQGLGGIHSTRKSQIGNVVKQQEGTKSKSQTERQQVTDFIKAIKDTTQRDVTAILEAMDKGASEKFENGLKRAETAYENAFDEAKGGFGSWLWGQVTFSWDEHIEESLKTARRVYLAEVDRAIDEVADFVEAKLDEAKQRIAKGRKEVETYVNRLNPSLAQYGEEALQAVNADFDAMGTEINQHSDALVNKLTDQYKASYERMSAMEAKLRDENKSLWQRVYDAAVGVVQTIINLKNMLLNVLARAAAAVDLIIADPIGFLGNLVSGIKLGLTNFMSKIGQYLQKALMEWLFGALAGAGIQMPETFDLKGIFSLVMQILGLTYANIRARAVAIVGEKVISALETAAEIFKILITQGVGGLWEYIKEKVGDLKTMVLEQIKSFVIERIVMAGITWVIGLLNPASAFIKACKAIYDIIMFFVERGSQIMALVNAVIDSVTAIAKGNISVAATFVENALAKALPVVISFLASLLGLGGISEKIKSIIETIRKPINAAIDWVIYQAVKLVKAAGKFVSGLFGSKKEERKEDENTKTGDSEDIYAQANKELSARLPEEATLTQVNDVAADVLQVLKPLGLKNLFVKELEEDFTLVAEASPGKELAGLVPKDKNITVTLSATLKLSGEASLERITRFFTPPKEAQSVTGGRRVASLPPADAPIKMPARDERATRESGAVLIEPAVETEELEVIAWNTGNPIKGTNVSHAERQLHDWLKHEHKLKPRVKGISIQLNRSPCGDCTNYLVGLLEMIPLAKGNSTIAWTELHRGKIATTAEDIAKLKKAGWMPSGPFPSGTVSESKPPVKVIVRRRS